MAITNLSIRCRVCEHTEQRRIEVPSVIGFFCPYCKEKRAARIELLYDDGDKRLIVTRMYVRELRPDPAQAGSLEITIAE